MEHLQEVEQYYTELYELPLEVTSGGAPDPEAEETLARLRRLGFSTPGAATAVLGRWKREPYPVVRDPRSRELLDSLTPALLTAMLGTVDPDLALERFDHLLSCLPDGLQMFSLFQANLHVMEHVAEMMVCAPAIAERVAERPTLFQALLESEADGVVPDRTGLEEDLDRHLESSGEGETHLVSPARVGGSSRASNSRPHSVPPPRPPPRAGAPQLRNRQRAPGAAGAQHWRISLGPRPHRSGRVLPSWS